MARLTQEDKDFFSDDSLSTLQNPKGSSHLILLAILVFFVAVFLWASLFRVDVATHGMGKVIPSRQVQVVQNLEGGIIERIYVHDGDTVKKGQVLMKIDDTQFNARYKSNNLNSEELEITLARLKAEIEDKPFELSQKLTNKQSQAVRYEKALFKSRKSELTELNKNYSLALKELELTEPLIDEGAVSPVEVLRLKRTVSQAKAEINRFQSTLLDEFNNTKTQLASLKEMGISEKDRLHRTTVRSPVNGNIKRILVTTEGGVIKPGMDLVEIVPADDTLLIEAKVSPKDIGFLHPGLKASVSLTAFNSAEHGTLEGNVEHISSDAIEDENGRGQYYLIRVRTQKNYLGSKNDPLYIIPGMIADVNILTGSRTVMNYIMFPITRGLKTALSEQ